MHLDVTPLVGRSFVFSVSGTFSRSNDLFFFSFIDLPAEFFELTQIKCTAQHAFTVYFNEAHKWQFKCQQSLLVHSFENWLKTTIITVNAPINEKNEKNYSKTQSI